MFSLKSHWKKLSSLSWSQSMTVSGVSSLSCCLTYCLQQKIHTHVATLLLVRQSHADHRIRRRHAGHQLFQLRAVQMSYEKYLGVGSLYKWGVVVLGGLPVYGAWLCLNLSCDETVVENVSKWTFLCLPSVSEDKDNNFLNGNCIHRVFFGQWFSFQMPGPHDERSHCTRSPTQLVPMSNVDIRLSNIHKWIKHPAKKPTKIQCHWYLFHLSYITWQCWGTSYNKSISCCSIHQHGIESV